MDPDTCELTLIDSGIDDLRDIPIRTNLLVLNLHSNYIRRIQHLSQLQQLRHLDLSSNQITRIEGLDGLASLKTLNLSCNLIREVNGLSALRSLTKVNLSYNQIEEIHGLSDLSGPQYKLSHVELHGNKLHSLTRVTQALIGCFNLRRLVLLQDGSGNPLCHQPGYHIELMRSIPQLKYLDGKDKNGRLCDASDVVTEIPGLEEYMDFLISSGSSEIGIPDVVTPKIDQALAIFRQRRLGSGDVSTIASSTDTDQIPTNDRNIASINNAHKTDDQESRLKTLENQLAQLLRKHPEASNLPISVSPSSSSRSQIEKQSDMAANSRELDNKGLEDTEGSDLTETAASPNKRRSRKTKKSKVPTYRKSTSSSRAKSEERLDNQLASSSKNREDEDKHRDLVGIQKLSNTEKEYRDDIKLTYMNLMKELEIERERRWKAELAAKKLANHVQAVQVKAKEDSDTKMTALEATGQLKKAIMNEREMKLGLQEENESLKDKLAQLSNELAQSKQNENSQKMALQSLEGTLTKQEREKLQQQTHEMKKLQDAQMKSAAMTREAEMLRHTTESQKGQLTQLRELLASREQEHREEMKRRFTLDSPQLQKLIQTEAEIRASCHAQEVTSQREKIDELSHQYTNLEDEFRMALQIESNRFNKVQREFETVSQENNLNRPTLINLQKKDEKSTRMISELTAMVKEQKGRITELSKAKYEQNADFKERISTLEVHVHDARKGMVQFELLKKENNKLTAEFLAQESVIEGLKAERRLWGKELAQQGASLAQDRGRLDSKIEILSQENLTIKKQLERETDSVRIKTKVIDDQTETIRKLKDGLVERDSDIRKAREETIKSQRDTESQLLDEKTINQDLQDEVDRLNGRKNDLKSEVSALRDELDTSQKAHGILNAKWKEKSSLIGQLEKHVQLIRGSWEDKEKKLSEERDQAIDAANLAIKKLRGMDDSFRKQLECKEEAHREELASVHEEKQREVGEANRQIDQVENEMRQLLRETESNKRGMEDKMKRLTSAMGDLQSDLF